MLLIVYRRIPMHSLSHLIPYAATRERLGTIEAIQSYCCDMVAIVWVKILKKIGLNLKAAHRDKKIPWAKVGDLGITPFWGCIWISVADGRSSIIGHIPRRWRQVMLSSWSIGDRARDPLASYLPTLRTSWYHNGQVSFTLYGMIWNWHGNGSIIILAGGSPETFSYLRVLLSAGYWRISN